MSRLVGEEDGFVLTDVLVSMTIMLLVLTATLVSFERFQQTTRANQLQNDASERARVGIDALARELRNHASATPQLPQGIERAQADDLIVQSAGSGAVVDGARPSRRVRYCLDRTDPANVLLVRQLQGWTGATPPTMPADTACPGATTPPSTNPEAPVWGSTEVVADHVANGARPVFAYNATTLDQITEIRSDLWVDYEPAREPAATRIDTGVFLRNQNRAPEAGYTVTPIGSSYVLLNASDSVDEDGDSLSFVWFDNGAEIGRGMVLEYRLPPGTRRIGLTVQDPAGRIDTAEERTVAGP